MLGIMNLRKLLLLLISMHCLTLLNAQTFTVDGIKYKVISQNEVEVGDNKFSKKEFVEIPESVRHKGISYSVVGIGNEAFTRYSIFDNLDKYIYNLKYLSLPKSVRYIGGGAFYKNKGLKKIDFGNGIKSIGGSAFSGCESLEDLELPVGVSCIGSQVFWGCKRLEKVVIPNSVDTIGTEAFCLCSSLKTVVFLSKSSLRCIGESIFYECKSLKELVLPEGLRNIGERAFWCSSLEKVVIPNSVETIGKEAFSGCSSLKIVEFPLPKSSLRCIEKEAFNGCKSLKELVLPEGLCNIGESAFNYCNSLEKVIIPNSVDTIGENAFYFSNLETVVLPDHGIVVNCDVNISDVGSVFGYVRKNVIGHSVKYPPSIYPNIELPKEFRTKYISKRRDCEINLDEKEQHIIKNHYGAVFLSERLPEIKKTFSYQYTYWIKSKIGEWQRKKEYETVSQWKARVTEAARKKELERLMNEARANYIKKAKPEKFSCVIDNYDAEECVYKLKADGFVSPFYVKVPVGEAPTFKENFDKAVKTPEYCIKNDILDIASCTFTLNGKKYVSPQIYDDNVAADMALDLPPLTFDSEQAGTENFVADMIDENIPSGNGINNNTFAVIIGNETYSKVSKVEYAGNDAAIFAQYCSKTLGIPTKNVRSYINATYGTMMTALRDIRQISEAYKGNINVIFYYAGHGVPNESNHNAYLLPVDVDGSQTDLCLSVSKLYQELNSLNARSVIVFLDACFSGAQRGEGTLMAARGVAIKAKPATPQGNMVVFSAASGDETAYPYKEKGHGLFTYYLLKKLQETKGDVTLGELGRYIVDNVTKESVVSNGKSQTPTVVPSDNVVNGWENMKLR